MKSSVARAVRGANVQKENPENGVLTLAQVSALLSLRLGGWEAGRLPLPVVRSAMVRRERGRSADARGR